MPPAQPPSPTPGRSGAPNRPVRCSASTPKPPSIPITNAASVLAIANGVPSTAAVRTNMDGSISGEASQKAITGASGTPMASRAAISGITPHEQKGDNAPMPAAKTIIALVRPVNARAIKLSAPLAAAYAAKATERRRKGRTPVKASRVKRKERSACCGANSSSAAKMATTAVQARSSASTVFGAASTARRDSIGLPL